MTILNQTEIMQTPLWLPIAGIVFAVLGMTLFVIGLATQKLKIVISSLPILLLTLFICILDDVYKVPTGRYRYECTVDPKTSISEIYENYKVAERRGDLWILEDKDEH